MTSESLFTSNKVTYLAVAFCAATMIANVMSLRMVAPLGIVMDAGALLYPVTFILRDHIHRDAGFKAANRTVTMSVVCNIAMFSLFALAAWLPYDPQTGAQEQYADVLLPGILIVLGSVTAQFVSERIDGRIYQAVYRDDNNRHIRAVVISNLISIPIDSIIMCALAFGFTIPFESVVATIGANIAIKYVVMLIAVAVYKLAAPKNRSRDI